MLSALGPDGQHATIAKFIQNELDAERGKVALLHQQGSQQTELLREQSDQQFELLRQQQAAATGSTHSRRPDSLKIDISKYKAAEEDSLLRWFVELDDAIGLVTSEPQSQSRGIPLLDYHLNGTERRDYIPSLVSPVPKRKSRSPKVHRVPQG